MLCGMKGYGFNWKLGADRLFLVSVGTGNYRMMIKPRFLLRSIPGYFAATSLQGLIGDADTLSLTLLQWLSAPRHRWEINSEIGSLEGELFGSGAAAADKAFLSFVRYDARLEKQWLSENLGARPPQELSESYIDALQQLDRPDMMDELYRIGESCAESQVTADDFPERFNAAPRAQLSPPLRAGTAS
jgi:hypothetical protein